jgi:hypothetical protein
MLNKRTADIQTSNKMVFIILVDITNEGKEVLPITGANAPLYRENMEYYLFRLTGCPYPTATGIQTTKN